MVLTTPLTVADIPVEGLAHSVVRACGMRPNDTDDLAHALYAAQTVVGLLAGHLRGRMPLPLPMDLQAVVHGAAVRYALTLAQARGVKPVGEAEQPPMPTFQGWTFPEAVVLARYRQRTL
jgi:hypothetical protein